MRQIIRRWTAVVLLFAILSVGSAYAFEDGWMHILLLGCDSYTTHDLERTDAMVILSIHKETGKIKMASLLRDIAVVDPVTGKIRKMNEECVYGGPDRTLAAINSFLKTDIEDYVLISLAGIAEVVDILGGIDVEISEEERKALNKGLFDFSSRSAMETVEETGMVHLNGNQATAYLRIRRIDSDRYRVQRERNVLLSLAEILYRKTNLLTVATITGTLMNYVSTNLSLSDLIQVCCLCLTADLESVEEFRIPAANTYEESTRNGIWFLNADSDLNAIEYGKFLYGKSSGNN